MADAPPPGGGDPRIPLALAATLMLETAAALVWAGAAGERLAQLEERLSTTTDILERTARLEEQAGYMRASLERIEAKLDARSD